MAVEPNSLYKVEAWVHIPQDLTTPHAERSVFKKAGELSYYGAFLRGDLLSGKNAVTKWP